MTKLTLRTEGDRHVVVTRRFNASPARVYRAHIEPDLIKRWMLGPEGWTMPVCICDARPGGEIRFEWSKGQGAGLSLTGEFVSLEPFEKIVHVERWHVPDPTPDNRIETVLEADGHGTLMTVCMTLPDEATRRATLETGLEHGMEASYARLDNLEWEE
jgi:uncharacterized protein YndB with AHSA1/START domain